MIVGFLYSTGGGSQWLCVARIHQVAALGQRIIGCDPPPLKMHTKSPTKILVVAILHFLWQMFCTEYTHVRFLLGQNYFPEKILVRGDTIHNLHYISFV